MSGRISDERLAEIILDAQEYAEVDPDSEDNNSVLLACVELQRNRALVTELRALAERMRDFEGLGSHVARMFSVDLRSILAAHDAQQAEGRE